MIKERPYFVNDFIISALRAYLNQESFSTKLWQIKKCLYHSLIWVIHNVFLLKTCWFSEWYHITCNIIAQVVPSFSEWHYRRGEGEFVKVSSTSSLQITSYAPFVSIKKFNWNIKMKKLARKFSLLLSMAYAWSEIILFLTLLFVYCYI